MSRGRPPGVEGSAGVFSRIKRVILGNTDRYRSLCRKRRAAMNRSTFIIIGISLGLGSLVCGCIDPIPGKNDMNTEAEEQEMMPPLSEIAGLLAELPLEAGHMTEVHDAVSASSQNGYDEEYTMSNLFSVPGSGVGDEHLGTRAAQKYENPLSELIRDHLMSKAGTKSSAGGARFTDEEDVDRYLGALASSDIQVYWPFSGSWDGSGGLPVITFDPEDESTANIGYRITVDPDGNRQIDTVIVDEQTAMETPVWVVNRNSDDGYLSLDMIRQLYPGWEEEGGNLVIRPSGNGKAYGRMGTAPVEGPLPAGTGTATATVKTLVLKDFTMNRNYDSWFAGASEFFVKCGSVENFTASTEAELQLYSPSVTDFMIVVKRDQVGKPQPFNAVLISDWTEQVDNCAFMIIEDDGGKQTSWECTALVRVASKSYGIEIDLPFRTRDDIVWRGSLSSRYLTANNNRPENFGDVSITFEIEENGAE